MRATLGRRTGRAARSAWNGGWPDAAGQQTAATMREVAPLIHRAWASCPNPLLDPLAASPDTALAHVALESLFIASCKITKRIHAAVENRYLPPVKVN